MRILSFDQAFSLFWKSNSSLREVYTRIAFTNPAPPHFQLYFGLYYHFTRKSEILVFLICSYKIAKKKERKTMKRKESKSRASWSQKYVSLLYVHYNSLFTLCISSMFFQVSFSDCRKRALNLNCTDQKAKNYTNSVCYATSYMNS